jgi:hypothetical protein
MLQHNLAVADKAIDCEVIGDVTTGATVIKTEDFIQVMATIQIIVPTQREISLLIFDKLHNMEKQISICANNIDYLESKLLDLQEQGVERAKLMEALYDTNERLKAKDTVLKNLPQWHSVSAVAEARGLSADAVRKQLNNGEFESGVDFKKPNGKILINQGAIERIQRKRRNSDA